MNFFQRFCCFVLIASLCYSLCFQQQNNDVWGEVKSTVDNYTAISNMVLIVGIPDQPEFFVYSKGNTTMQTYMPVASASKWVSGLVLMKMYELGMINLYDPVNKWIPWWTTNQSDSRSFVTMDHLLSFRSGFNNESSCIGNFLDTLENCAQQIYSTGVTSTPGSTFVYASTHLTIAGVVALHAANVTSWETLFSRYIRTPLTLPQNIAYFPLNNPNLAGSLLSTPESYTQILNAIFSKKIINSTTTALMEQNHTPDSSYNWAYGYTNWLECTGLNECSNFTGVHSSPGLFGFYPWIDRLHNYFAIIATENGPLGYAISLVLGQRLQPLIVKALETLSSSPYESPFTSLSSPSFTSPSPTTSNSSTPTSLFVPSSSSIPLTKASVSNLIVYCLLFVILLFQM